MEHDESVTRAADGDSTTQRARRAAARGESVDEDSGPRRKQAGGSRDRRDADDADGHEVLTRVARALDDDADREAPDDEAGDDTAGDDSSDDDRDEKRRSVQRAVDVARKVLDGDGDGGHRPRGA
ncbi:hypothetical protein BJF90_22085 [Pseudonocardia sp. CNS-004]|nr:hypothetical protein BJF90_22085 [Pseudonocardia sp. CNS-004]